MKISILIYLNFFCVIYFDSSQNYFQICVPDLVKFIVRQNHFFHTGYLSSIFGLFHVSQFFNDEKDSLNEYSNCYFIVLWYNLNINILLYIHIITNIILVTSIGWILIFITYFNGYMKLDSDLLPIFLKTGKLILYLGT